MKRALLLALLASASVTPTGAGVEHAPGARRGAALRRPEDYERLMARTRPSFTTSEAILKARHVEDRLMADTWSLEGYDLLPKLRGLTIPTLVIYGDHDFIPSFVAEHIVAALPTARFVTMKECGHFAFLECPGPVRKEIDGLIRHAGAPAGRHTSRPCRSRSWPAAISRKPTAPARRPLR